MTKRKTNDGNDLLVAVFSAITLAIFWLVSILIKGLPRIIKFLKDSFESSKAGKTGGNQKNEIYKINNASKEENAHEEPDESFSIEVDESIAQIYNLIVERIGSENCTFLNPHQDNSELLDKIDETNNDLAAMGIYNKQGTDLHAAIESLDFENITVYTEAKKSGEKSKLFFINNDGEKCTTEDVAIEYYNNKGYFAIRAEVVFWQLIFCISFFEEIYCKFWDLFNDIPLDYFKNSFYFMRAELINKKIEKIKNSKNLKDFIKQQIKDFGGYNSRLLYPWGIDFNIEKCNNDFVLGFFDTIPAEHFIKLCENMRKILIIIVPDCLT